MCFNTIDLGSINDVIIIKKEKKGKNITTTCIIGPHLTCPYSLTHSLTLLSLLSWLALLLSLPLECNSALKSLHHCPKYAIPFKIPSFDDVGFHRTGCSNSWTLLALVEKVACSIPLQRQENLLWAFSQLHCLHSLRWPLTNLRLMTRLRLPYWLDKKMNS